MRRLLALLLAAALLLTGCAPAQAPEEPEETAPQTAGTEEAASEPEEPAAPVPEETPAVWEDDIPDYASLSDAGLLGHVEDLVYRETVSALDSDAYFVEQVSAVYISKEYLEEVAYNSQSNLYFGYTLDELDALFQGTRYIFTLGEDGQTTVQELQELTGPAIEGMLLDLAIGGGVILLCVTVAARTGAVNEDISFMFAMAAQDGMMEGLYASNAYGALMEGLTIGVQTGDWDAALDAAAQFDSEGFRCGVFSGTLDSLAGSAAGLLGAAFNGLDLAQAAQIQWESRFPLDVIKLFRTMAQYEVCRDAGLMPHMLNGQTALVREIDLNYVDETGRTNLERMQEGLAALDGSGTAYQLCRAGGEEDGTLAILTEEERLQAGSDDVWQVCSEDTASFWRAVSRSV